MDFQDFIGHAREHYLGQFREFVAREQAACQRGGPEVRVSMKGREGLVRGLYCADFATNDEGGPAYFDFQPDRLLQFDPMDGALAAMRLTMDAFRWDRVVIVYDGFALPDETLEGWFDTWFEAEDAEPDAAPREFAGAIHSVFATPGRLMVDFGTAPPGAFWTLLRLLEQTGATAVKVSA